VDSHCISPSLSARGDATSCDHGSKLQKPTHFAAKPESQSNIRHAQFSPEHNIARRSSTMDGEHQFVDLTCISFNEKSSLFSDDSYDARSFFCRSTTDAEMWLKSLHGFTSCRGFPVTTSRQLFKRILANSTAVRLASLPNIVMTDVTTSADAFSERLAPSDVDRRLSSAAVQCCHSSDTESVDNDTNSILIMAKYVPGITCCSLIRFAIAYELMPSFEFQPAENSLDATSINRQQFKFRQKHESPTASVHELPNVSW